MSLHESYRSFASLRMTTNRRCVILSEGSVHTVFRDVRSIVATPQNLMELIPASHLKQNYYRAETMTILGLAADKKEAFDLCHKMIRDCYVGNGVIDRAGLWGGGQ